MKFWRKPDIQKWGVGQVVITTQNKDDIPVGKTVLHESFEQGLEEEEAVELLKKVSMVADQLDHSDIQAVKQVAMELDYQPLALVNAAMYTRRISTEINSNFHWVDYLVKLKAGKQELMEDRVAKKNEFYPIGMVLATRLVIEELFNSSEILKYIFFALSFCSHAPVPVDLLTSYVQSEIGDVDKEDVLIVLKECSLLLWTEQSGVRTVTVHQVTYQRFLELQNKDEDIYSSETLFSTWLDTMGNFTKGYVADNVTGTYTTLSLLKPHLPVPIIQTKTNSSTELQSFTPPTMDIRCRAEYEHLGFLRKLYAFRNVYKKLYDFNNTLNYEHAIFQIQNLCPGISVSERSNTLVRLGIVYSEIGELQKAEEYVLQSLEMKKSFHGESAPDIAATLTVLGQVYQKRGNLQKAEYYFIKSLEMDKLFHGESAPSIAITLNTLGQVYQGRGNLQEAEEYYVKSLEMCKSFYGESAPSMVVTLNNLGELYQERGDLKNAVEYFLKSLEMETSFHGDSGPRIAVLLKNLGSVYYALGDLEEAKNHFLQAFKMFRLFYPDSHPNIVDAKKWLKNISKKLTDSDPPKQNIHQPKD